MKKIIYILSLILFLPIVFSLQQEKVVYEFESCNNNISIDVTAKDEIIIGEYSLKDCNMVGLNRWFCECDGKYNLVLLTNFNTINNYTFSINYSYTSNSTEDLQDIRIKNEDIKINSLEYKNLAMYFVLEGDGKKTASIYVGSFGSPYKLYINNQETNFDYLNNTVIFDIHFSTNNVTLDYNYPSQESIGVVSGGGGGGGGGAFTIRFEVDKPMTKMLKLNVISRFWVDGKQHTIKVVKIFENSTRIEVESELQTIDLFLNEPRIINVDGGDLELTLTETRGNVVFIKFEKLAKAEEKPIAEEFIEEEKEIIEEEKLEKIEEVCETCGGGIPIEEIKSTTLFIVLFIAIIVIGGCTIYFYLSHKRKNLNNKHKKEDKENEIEQK